MGNQHSQNDSSSSDRRPFARPNALGLSRSELDKRCQPSGLYDSCLWEDKAIRRLVGDGKVASRYEGGEAPTTACNDECPICFLYYPEINTTKCCHANLCTECFLQIRPQKEKQSTCPFCNHSKLQISIARCIAKSKSKSNSKSKATTEDKEGMEQARIRSDGETTTTTTTTTAPIPINRPPKPNDQPNQKLNKTGFGASLEQDSRVASFRARSESFASSGDRSVGEDRESQTHMIHSLAMTPEERRRLEAEMRNQNVHPLALQVEAEAQQRALQNERAYHRSNSDRRDNRSSDLYGSSINSRSSRRRGRLGSGSGGARNWSEIVDAFEQHNGNNGAVNSLDDLVVLEAAILLSMEEEANEPGGDQRDEDFDATRHARDGFPLVQSFLAHRGRVSEPANAQQVQNLARSLRLGRRRNQLLRSGQGSQSSRAMPDTTRDTAAMLMRGISEEEQMAMAIAASLQEPPNSPSTTTNEENEDGTTSSSELSLSSGTATVGVLVEEENSEDGDGDTEAVISEAVEPTDSAELAEEATPSEDCNTSETTGEANDTATTDSQTGTTDPIQDSVEDSEPLTTEDKSPVQNLVESIAIEEYPAAAAAAVASLEEEAS